MKLFIGSDKSGFILKEAIKGYLQEKGYEIEDIGTRNIDEPKPFFEVAPIGAKKIQSGSYEKGILICGTGMGMAMVANKYEGVYAAVVESVYAAKKCRAINDANVLTMGGWIVSDMMAFEMVDAFLDTAFTEGLEPWRQEFLEKAKQKVKEIEDSIYKA
ncbi:MAG: RpiB/LacA/LacB family sugar-phosphate isomerase [Clostridia bacterium]|jgi:ribose 5-phosphate isomerase B|nr:RpiB/LacA/LacB family sugar-phosphate isomerase [Clostridia bacterium]